MRCTLCEIHTYEIYAREKDLRVRYAYRIHVPEIHIYEMYPL
jgi:hypothetical protein